MTDYIPVDCDQHSIYELAVMRRTRLRVRWNDPDGRARTGLLNPLDLQTRNREEFLIAEDAQGKPLEIRLDQIVSIQPIS